MLSQVEARISGAGDAYFELRYHQTVALFYKNFLLLSRYWVTTVLQVLAVPFIIVLLLVAFQGLVNVVEVNNKPVTDPVAEEFSGISRCQKGYDMSYCVTIAVVRPSSIATEVNSIIGILLSQNTNTIPSDEVKYFDSENELDDFIFYNENITQGGIIFSSETNYGSTQISYTIQANTTVICDAFRRCNDPDVEVIVPYKLATDRAILTYQRQLGVSHLLSSSSTSQSLDVERVQYSHPLYQGYDIFFFWGGQLFFAAVLFGLVIQAEQIVQEKESKLRAGMQVMGLKNSVYWITWFITHFILQQLSFLSLFVFGILVGMQLFIKNDLIVVYLLFTLFGISMTGIAYIVSAIVKQARIASFVGFSLFLIGFVTYPLAIFVIYSEGVDSDPARWICGLFSPMVYAKSIADLSRASGEGQDGIRWYDIHDNDDVWPIINTFYVLVIDSILYFLIAWYLDSVLPVEYGVSQPWYYIFSPFYWTDHSCLKRKSATLSTEENINEEEEEAMKATLDEDVWEERQRVLRDDCDEDVRVKVINLKKVYKKWPIRSKWDFTAVKGLNLHVKKDSLFCLLGHNGAGKTTTFNMLVGMFAPTEGDCLIDGKSVRRDVAELRSKLGFCPQHDLLWPVLTAREHLRIYASFKNLPSALVDEEIETRLNGVGLGSMGDVATSEFSAGLRRRLSIAISLIGNPSILYLDEPTTGMGPVAMRQVWKIIQESKKGRVTILTTHSMQEAEMLADRIGIMNKGQFAALGTSSHLRQKFGVGTQLKVRASLEELERVAATVMDSIPDCIQIPSTQEDRGDLEFAVPASTPSEVVLKVLQSLEAEKSKGAVKGFGIGLSSLEDVFLGIAHKAAEEGFDANDADAKKKVQGKEMSEMEKVEEAAEEKPAWSEETSQQ
jgi:ABC-type multidrug transport system ATPase subunit